MDDNKTVFRGVADQDKTVISKILQRFRPIAPKPTLNNFKIESFGTTKKNKRSKRKYVRVKNNKNVCNKEIINPNFNTEMDIVTLQLLPEKEQIQKTGNSVNQNSIDLNDKDSYTKFMNITNSIKEISSSLDQTKVESWIIVECVIGVNHMDLSEERVLDVDTCPWFVSDWLNRVCWVNRAYQKMNGEPEEEMKVWLVVGVDLMNEIGFIGELYGAVTCRVRVRYEPSTWKKEKCSLMKNMTMLCDVYKIGSNGFAWRLDVESALKLSI